MGSTETQGVGDFAGAWGRRTQVWRFFKAGAGSTLLMLCFAKQPWGLPCPPSGLGFFAVRGKACGQFTVLSKALGTRKVVRVRLLCVLCTVALEGPAHLQWACLSLR